MVEIMIIGALICVICIGVYVGIRKTPDTLYEAIKNNLELKVEIAEKDAKIAELRSESWIAKEALERYCPPQLLDGAMIWLREANLAKRDTQNWPISRKG